MLKQFGDAYAFLCGRPAWAKFNKALFYLSSRALGLNNYASPRLSGETRAVIDRIGSMESPIVFDVGANNGVWSGEVLKANKSAQIHAFEPQASLAARISATMPGLAAINNVALGEKPGELDLYDYADHPGSGHASLLEGVIDSIHGGRPRKTKVQVTTIDDYCQSRNVSHIHFLKIDVEGFELSVLRGAKAMLAEGRVEAVQFEFNEMNVAGRTFLKDFMALLGESFSFYRILPHGLIPLKANNFWFNEQYTYQNLLAVRS